MSSRPASIYLPHALASSAFRRSDLEENGDRQAADVSRDKPDPLRSSATPLPQRRADRLPKAIPALRERIDRIVCTPNPKGRGVLLEVDGRLAAIIDLASGKSVLEERLFVMERVKGTRNRRKWLVVTA